MKERSKRVSTVAWLVHDTPVAVPVAAFMIVSGQFVFSHLVRVTRLDAEQCVQYF